MSAPPSAKSRRISRLPALQWDEIPAHGDSPMHPGNDDRLSELMTQWTVIFDANSSRRTAAKAAQEALVLRYGAAVYRYMFSVVKRHDVVEDLCQEFARRLVEGDF